ncbi:MAG: cyclic pyranopterin monophosphate synthase MoaC [Gammaproteobacteria bacterium WSBS_2016_MAG_OTU1]
MNKLTHLDSQGQAHMVDVGDKTPNRRVAIAGGNIRMSVAAFTLLQQGTAAKGDVLATARIAAIMAAKKTAEWIPLCHSLPLESVAVDFTLDDKQCSVYCRATVATTAKTGVEMEALTAVQAGLLTVYDMLKAVDKTMIIGNICLLEKRGGKSGTFIRSGGRREGE